MVISIHLLWDETHNVPDTICIKMIVLDAKLCRFWPYYELLIKNSLTKKGEKTIFNLKKKYPTAKQK